MVSTLKKSHLARAPGWFTAIAHSACFPAKVRAPGRTFILRHFLHSIRSSS